MTKFKWAFISLLILLSPVAATSEGGGGDGESSGIGDIKLDSKIESMKKAGVGPVIFPHLKHENAYKCDDCHPKIFKAKRGANEFSMKLTMDGKSCAAPGCHSNPGFNAPGAVKLPEGTKLPFPLINCANCHSNVTGPE